MKQVMYIIYRYLSEADYFNIYKPTGTEIGGGGQTYIDFPVSLINKPTWDLFFDGLPKVVIKGVAQGDKWTFPVWSIGVGKKQEIWIYQRRAASISIAAQNINTRGAKRVFAWHPDYGFPKPRDAKDRHQLPEGLAIFLVRTKYEVWAGWFNKNDDRIYQDDSAKYMIREMISKENVKESAGFINLSDSELYLHENERNKPFSTTEDTLDVRTSSVESTAEKGLVASEKSTKEVETEKKKSRTGVKRKKRDESQIIEDLFEEDDEYDGDVEDEVKEKIVRIRKRNTKAVKLLKELYEHKCQITEKEYIFKKKDGTNYTEAHHLIPLGEGGADNPLNMIIVSPLIHRMLHYAKVSEIDLGEIKKDKAGVYYLSIVINDAEYEIRWHPDHIKKIEEITVN